MSEQQLQRLKAQIARETRGAMPYSEQVALSRAYEQLSSGTRVATQYCSKTFEVGTIRKVFKANSAANYSSVKYPKGYNIIELDDGRLYEPNPLHVIVLAFC